VRSFRSPRSLICLPAAALMLALMAQPAAAGFEEGLKALQSGDMPAAEKELQPLAKERDPRAQFLLGFYVYGGAESKLFDVNKASPLLLDAAERGYLPAMIPLAGAYSEGNGVPKSAFEAYKWIAIAERWNVPNANMALEQASRDLNPEEIAKAKAAAQAYTFKTK
jgi:TPR repeat protein